MGAVEALRVLLVDDEALIRAGLRLVLDGNQGITIVGEAADGVEGVALARELQPDVVLMDVRMPRLDGVEATRQVRAAGEDAPAVVVLTAFDTDEFVLGALRAGAAGFLLKHTPPPQLVDAVRQAAAGTMSFSPEALARLVSAVAAPAPPGVERVAALSERESEIAWLVTDGLTNAEIAGRLFLSVPTIKTHLVRIFEKLGVTNRVQLALLVHDSRR